MRTFIFTILCLLGLLMYAGNVRASNAIASPEPVYQQAIATPDAAPMVLALALIASIQAIPWVNLICTVTMGLLACVYVAKKYRSVGYRLRQYFSPMGWKWRGRALAINVLTSEFQTSRGNGGYIPDAAIAFQDSVVKLGSSDRNIAVASLQADVPIGILLHDLVSSGDVGAVQKQVAIFGLYPESLPFVASGAIAALQRVVVDPANPGQLMALPAVAGTYVVVGVSRFAIAGAQDSTQPNDRGSLIHQVPYFVNVDVQA